MKLVDSILSAKRGDAGADTAALEREIDEAVYGLYGLTAEEIALVEGRADGGRGGRWNARPTGDGGSGRAGTRAPTGGGEGAAARSGAVGAADDEFLD